MTPFAAITGPATSALCLWRGLGLLNSPELRSYVWTPLLINVLLYGLGFWAASHYFELVMNWLIPAWLDWLRWLLWPLFFVILLAVAFFTFTLLANLIGAPFYGLLAEKAHRLVTGQVPTNHGRPWVRDLTTSLASEAARMVYIASRALPLLPLLLVPVLNIAISVIWLLFGAWSLAVEYLAYPMELRGLTFREQRAQIKQRRLESLAFGGAVMLGLSIPLLNVFIPPAAVIGATLYYAQRGPLSRPVAD